MAGGTLRTIPPATLGAFGNSVAVSNVDEQAVLWRATNARTLTVRTPHHPSPSNGIDMGILATLEGDDRTIGHPLPPGLGGRTRDRECALVVKVARQKSEMHLRELGDLTTKVHVVPDEIPLPAKTRVPIGCPR
jgi:hypothetical protein